MRYRLVSTVVAKSRWVHGTGHRVGGHVVYVPSVHNKQDELIAIPVRIERVENHSVIRVTGLNGDFVAVGVRCLILVVLVTLEVGELILVEVHPIGSLIRVTVDRSGSRGSAEAYDPEDEKECCRRRSEKIL